MLVFFGGRNINTQKYIKNKQIKIAFDFVSFNNNNFNNKEVNNNNSNTQYAHGKP